MRPLYALVASLGLVLLAAPVSAAASVEASPCSGGLCDVINDVCGGCIPAEDGSDCLGPVCDAINRVCHCLGSDASEAPTLEGTQVHEMETEAVVAGAHCMGEACDVINFVCYTAFKVYCVG